jgi:hypothetical protein
MTKELIEYISDLNFTYTYNSNKLSNDLADDNQYELEILAEITCNRVSFHKFRSDLISIVRPITSDGIGDPENAKSIIIGFTQLLQDYFFEDKCFLSCTSTGIKEEEELARTFNLDNPRIVNVIFKTPYSQVDFINSIRQLINDEINNLKLFLTDYSSDINEKKINWTGTLDQLANWIMFLERDKTIATPLKQQGKKAELIRQIQNSFFWNGEPIKTRSLEGPMNSFGKNETLKDESQMTRNKIRHNF